MRATGAAFERKEDSDHAERWRYAVPTGELVMVASQAQGPGRGRNFRKLTEPEFRELERVVRLNRG